MPNIISPFPPFYKETYYNPVYPPAFSDTYVKATSTYDVYYPYIAVNSVTSLTGGWAGWIGDLSSPANQRFHIDLGSPDHIKRIYYENAHNSGADTAVGAKNFTLWGSNDADAFADLTYGTDTGWTEINVGSNQFEQHISSNIADPKYILVKSTAAYRYYAIKIADNWGAAYMGIRRISLQAQMIVPSIPVAAKFLAHFDGADNGTVFTDECGHIATIHGSPITKTDIKKFGTAAFYSPNSTNYITYGSHADFDLGTYDITLACWVYILDDGRYHSLFSRRPSAVPYGWVFSVDPSNFVRFSCYIGGWADPFLVGITAVTKNALHYIELCRQGSNFFLFLDGGLEATALNAGAIQDTGNAFTIGAGSDAGEGSIYGYIDEAVLIREALHTAPYTPPIFPYSLI